jgi:hypothetical protein
MEGAQDKTNGKRKVSDTKDTIAAKNTETIANAHRHGEDRVDANERHAPVLNFMANSGLNSDAAHAGSCESHSGGCLEQQRRTKRRRKIGGFFFGEKALFLIFKNVWAALLRLPYLKTRQGVRGRVINQT